MSRVGEGYRGVPGRGGKYRCPALGTLLPSRQAPELACRKALVPPPLASAEYAVWCKRPGGPAGSSSSPSLLASRSTPAATASVSSACTTCSVRRNERDTSSSTASRSSTEQGVVSICSAASAMPSREGAEAQRRWPGRGGDSGAAVSGESSRSMSRRAAGVLLSVLPNRQKGARVEAGSVGAP